MSSGDWLRGVDFDSRQLSLDDNLVEFQLHAFLGVPAAGVVVVQVPNDLVIGWAVKNVLRHCKAGESCTLAIRKLPITALTIGAAGEVHDGGEDGFDGAVEVTSEGEEKGGGRFGLREFVAGPLVGTFNPGDVMEGTGDFLDSFTENTEIESLLVVFGVLHHRELPLGTGHLGGEGPMLIEEFREVGTALIEEKRVEGLILGVHPLNSEIVGDVLPETIEVLADSENVLFKCCYL